MGAMAQRHSFQKFHRGLSGFAGITLAFACTPSAQPGSNEEAPEEETESGEDEGNNETSDPPVDVGGGSDLPGDVALIRRMSPGVFAETSLGSWHGNAPTASVGDFDGDGYWDLHIFGFGADQRIVLDAGGSTPEELEVPEFIEVQLFTYIDLEDDGAQEIYLSKLGPSSGSGVLVVKNGQVVVQSVVPGDLPHVIASGDFDSDGFIDMIYKAHYQAEDYGIAWGTGGTVFEKGSPFRYPDGTCIKSTATFTVLSDGVSPVLVDPKKPKNVSDTCSPALYRVSGFSRDAAPKIEELSFTVAGDPVAVVDLDGDGSDDLIFAEDGQVWGWVQLRNREFCRPISHWRHPRNRARTPTK